VPALPLGDGTLPLRRDYRLFSAASTAWSGDWAGLSLAWSSFLSLPLPLPCMSICPPARLRRGSGMGRRASTPTDTRSCAVLQQS